MYKKTRFGFPAVLTIFSAPNYVRPPRSPRSPGPTLLPLADQTLIHVFLHQRESATTTDFCIAEMVADAVLSFCQSTCTETRRTSPSHLGIGPLTVLT